MDPVDILNIICYVVTAASVITRATPSTKDDEVVGLILKIVKLISIAPKEQPKS